MHVNVVFPALALGFIQLLILLVVTTLMLIQVKIFVVFHNTDLLLIKEYDGFLGTSNNYFNSSKHSFWQAVD